MKRILIILSVCLFICCAGCAGVNNSISGKADNRSENLSTNNSGGIDSRWQPLSLVNYIELNGNQIDFGKPVNYRIYCISSALLQQQVGKSHRIKSLRPSPECLAITISHDDIHHGTTKKQHIAPSFVVDYDDPVFDSIIKDVRALYGDKPKISEIASYTSEFIINKKSTLTLNFASTIARQKSGDCKDHAIFSTALSRKFGYPCRIVLGYVLIEITTVRLKLLKNEITI